MFSGLCDLAPIYLPRLDSALEKSTRHLTDLSGATHLPFPDLTHSFRSQNLQGTCVLRSMVVPEGRCPGDTAVFPGQPRPWLKYSVLPGEGFSALQFITGGVQRTREAITAAIGRLDKLLGWGYPGTGRCSRSDSAKAISGTGRGTHFNWRPTMHKKRGPGLGHPPEGL